MHTGFSILTCFARHLGHVKGDESQCLGILGRHQQPLSGKTSRQRYLLISDFQHVTLKVFFRIRASQRTYNSLAGVSRWSQHITDVSEVSKPSLFVAQTDVPGMACALGRQITGRCVRRFDHYCPIFNNAIGESNQAAFLLFLVVYLVGQTLFLQVACGLLAQRARCPLALSQAPAPDAAPDADVDVARFPCAWSVVRDFPVLAALVAVNVPAFVFCLGLLLRAVVGAMGARASHPRTPAIL